MPGKCGTWITRSHGLIYLKYTDKWDDRFADDEHTIVNENASSIY